MRYLVALVGVVVLLGGLGAIKAAQVATLVAFGREQERLGPPPEAVGVHEATEQTWELTIETVGSLTSDQGVSISAEAPGRVSQITFDSGATVRAGDVLLELDASVERAQLESALADRELAEIDAVRTRALVEADAAAQQELDDAVARLKTARAQVDELRALIAKKTVAAPFSGKLGIRLVNLGQYLAAGTPITVLQTTDTMFVDFTLPQQRLSEISVGMEARIELGDTRIAGTIETVEPVVDASTRAVSVRARVRRGTELEKKLRPGMFTEVAVVLPRTETFVTVPATAIVHAPYGDSVFIVEPKKADEPGIRETDDGEPVKVARQQFVETGPRRGDFVAVVEGIEAGQPVVSAGGFKLSNGSPVFVSDVAVSEPSLDPHPRNR